LQGNLLEKVMEILKGSCLCGAVEYEISGTPNKFYHCHCQRCRKASGTGHCSNIIMMKPEEVEWRKGEGMLSHYQVPEAIRFSTCFCKNCGSLLPRVAADGSMAVIPAGSLDTDPGIEPQARIFWGSRSDWSCGNADITIFSEYPE